MVPLSSPAPTHTPPHTKGVDHQQEGMAVWGVYWIRSWRMSKYRLALEDYEKKKRVVGPYTESPTPLFFPHPFPTHTGLTASKWYQKNILQITNTFLNFIRCHCATPAPSCVSDQVTISCLRYICYIQYIYTYIRNNDSEKSCVGGGGIATPAYLHQMFTAGS